MQLSYGIHKPLYIRVFDFGGYACGLVFLQRIRKTIKDFEANRYFWIWGRAAFDWKIRNKCPWMSMKYWNIYLWRRKVSNHRPIKWMARHHREKCEILIERLQISKFAKQLKFCLAFWHLIRKLFAQTNNYFRFRPRFFSAKGMRKGRSLIIFPFFSSANINSVLESYSGTYLLKKTFISYPKKSDYFCLKLKGLISKVRKR